MLTKNARKRGGKLFFPAKNVVAKVAFPLFLLYLCGNLLFFSNALHKKDAICETPLIFSGKSTESNVLYARRTIQTQN